MGAPRYLVFSGGGLHGLAFCGALLGLIDEGELDLSRVEGCVGTSIGALLSLAVCVGLSAERMRTLILERADWSRLHTGVNVASVVERYGLESRAGLEYLVHLVLADAGLSPTVTLRGAYALTKRHLCVCVGDLTHARLRYLDHTRAPDLGVCDAVVASMCVPVLFEPMHIDGIGLCVDGGIVENVPLRFFDAAESVCFCFATDDAPAEIDNWRDYVAAILRCAGQAKAESDAPLLQQHARVCTVRVPPHLPSSLEIHRVTPQLAQVFLTLGYLQASPRRARELEEVMGSILHLVCAVHSCTQELP